MVTPFYGGRTPMTMSASGISGRRIEDPRQSGTGVARGFFNGVPQQQRSFSALNYAPIDEKSYSALYGNSSDPRFRNLSALNIPSNRQSPIGVANNRKGLMTSSNRQTPIGIANDGVKQTNAGGTASQPNMMNSLLNYAQSPEGRGFAQGLLEASGYTDMPTTLGQAVSQGMKRSNEAKQLSIANQRKDDEISFKKSQALIGNLLAERGLDLQEMKLLQPQMSAFAKDLLAVGIDPMSPEGQELLRKKLDASTNITLTDNEIGKEKLKYALGTLKEERKVYNSANELDGRLQIMEATLRDDDFETGLLQKFLFPFAKSMAAMGFLDDSEVEELSKMEFFQAASTYMIPRMRAIGSGATSDFEVSLYTQAAPNIGNTKQGNIFIVAGMRAINKFNKNKFREMEKWVNKNNSLVGFEEYFEKEFGDTVFKQASTDEEYDQMVTDGKLAEGDLFLNKKTNTFVVITKDMLNVEEAK